VGGKIRSRDWERLKRREEEEGGVGGSGMAAEFGFSSSVRRLRGAPVISISPKVRVLDANQLLAPY